MSLLLTTLIEQMLCELRKLVIAQIFQIFKKFPIEHAIFRVPILSSVKFLVRVRIEKLSVSGSRNHLAPKLINVVWGCTKP